MYRDLCYWYWWKEWYYNTMEEESIIKSPWDVEPILHPHIEYLINNICNNKKKDINWIHESILWKLTHINNVHIPALILFWQWSSGKWTFMNLLTQIFWKENTALPCSDHLTALARALRPCPPDAHPELQQEEGESFSPPLLLLLQRHANARPPLPAVDVVGDDRTVSASFPVRAVVGCVRRHCWRRRVRD